MLLLLLQDNFNIRDNKNRRGCKILYLRTYIKIFHKCRK